MLNSNPFIGGSSGPGYSLLRFQCIEKFQLTKTTYLSSGRSAAIYSVYIWLNLIRGKSTTFTRETINTAYISHMFNVPIPLQDIVQ